MKSTSQTSLLSNTNDSPPLANWKSLFLFTSRGSIPIFSAAIILTVITGLVLPGMAILMGRIFGSFASFQSGLLNADEFLIKIKQDVLFLTALGGGSWLMGGTFFAAWMGYGEMVAQTLRSQIFDEMIEKDPDWYERKKGVSALVTRCQTYFPLRPSCNSC